MAVAVAPTDEFSATIVVAEPLFIFVLLEKSLSLLSMSPPRFFATSCALLPSVVGFDFDGASKRGFTHAWLGPK